MGNKKTEKIVIIAVTLILLLILMIMAEKNTNKIEFKDIPTCDNEEILRGLEKLILLDQDESVKTIEKNIKEGITDLQGIKIVKTEEIDYDKIAGKRFCRGKMEAVEKMVKGYSIILVLWPPSEFDYVIVKKEKGGKLSWKLIYKEQFFGWRTFGTKDSWRAKILFSELEKEGKLYDLTDRLKLRKDPRIYQEDSYLIYDPENGHYEGHKQSSREKILKEIEEE